MLNDCSDCVHVSTGMLTYNRLALLLIPIFLTLARIGNEIHVIVDEAQFKTALICVYPDIDESNGLLKSAPL
jgi:hypothetical protein